MIDDKEIEDAMLLSFDHETYGINRQELEELGERKARHNLSSGVYGQHGSEPFVYVSSWVADKEFARLAEDSAKRDAREEETLSIAKRALATSEDNAASARLAAEAAAKQATWARWAAILATIAAIIATKDQILQVIFHP